MKRSASTAGSEGAYSLFSALHAFTINNSIFPITKIAMSNTICITHA
jgi:hypothetical protein